MRYKINYKDIQCKYYGQYFIMIINRITVKIVTHKWKKPRFLLTDEWMKRYDAYIQWNITHITHKMEHIWISGSEVDEPRAYYAEWSKSEREKQISYIKAYIWNLEKWYWWTCLQRKNGDADQFSSVPSLSHVQLIETPWTATHLAYLCITNSWSLLKLMFIELVMPSNHLFLCHPLLPLSIFPSIGVFSNESALCIRWPNCWSLSFSINIFNEYSGLISFDYIDLCWQSNVSAF